MSYCNNCGKPLEEDQLHVCEANAEEAAFRETAAAQPVAAKEGFRPDKSILLGLLKDPLSAQRLQPATDLYYGFIGLAAAVCGFFLWGLALQWKLEAGLAYLFGFLGGEFGGGIGVAYYVLRLGLVSIVALIGALWLVGKWKGTRQPDWREIVTCLGSMQLLWGASFAAAAILTLVSLRLSFTVLLVALLSAFVLALLAAADLFGFRKEQRFVAVVANAAVYVLLTAVLGAILL